MATARSGPSSAAWLQYRRVSIGARAAAGELEARPPTGGHVHKHVLEVRLAALAELEQHAALLQHDRVVWR
jgi:hypothetical protein